MEGPSLHLAAELLRPFKGRRILRSSGNTKTVGVARFRNLKVKDIFSWGKHLVFQFDTFALRVHFMMFGTFEAMVNGTSVTGDYKRAKEPRLAFQFANGELKMFSCSVRVIESARAKAGYDFSVDLMSSRWNGRKALKALRDFPDEQIADVLLDQTVFAGLGNIIKNEILFLAGIRPTKPVRDISPAGRRRLVSLARSFSLQFYRWRRKFELRKHLQVHRKRACPRCGRALTRAKTGHRERWSYFCPVDQK